MYSFSSQWIIFFLLSDETSSFNSDCNYSFPSNLAANFFVLGVESIFFIIIQAWHNLPRFRDQFLHVYLFIVYNKYIIKWIHTLNTLLNIIHYICSFIFINTRKIYFHFLWNWMEYDRGDSFPFNFEFNKIPFGSKSNGKLSPWSYSIQLKIKWNIFLM